MPERKGGAVYSRGKADRPGAFLSSVIEQVPAMVFVKNADTLRFELFNKAGEGLLGIPRQAMIGKSDADFFPPEQVAFFAEKDRGVLHGKKLLAIPVEQIDTAYGRRWLYTRKLPVLDRRGIARQLLGISLDITGCRDVASALSRMRVEIEPLVAELKRHSPAMRLMLDNLDEGSSLGQSRFSAQHEPEADSSAQDLALLYAKYGRAILGHCQRSLGDSESGKDAAQEVFVRAYCHRRRWPAASLMAPWLFRIATNYCLNELRKRQVRLRARPQLTTQPISNPETLLAARRELGSLVDRLQPRAREIAHLTYVDGMLQHEVAEALGISRRTVVNQLNGLRARLEPR